ncbi:type III secretion protein HrpB1 [Hydrogenophaga palleronii]|uniref:Type III secretion protein HrpB1 n=1 Tax=Hydrogenophaga palleronii TaxID=65655 RepID=A0ABU1WKY5_9BURK|nr:HrpB1 family type III secretion system apparatus protein [Hydrogenophaga palleronii]MDR7149961.1 type III secretion protein HrpB1 [Hydrogenophaga palleronii]
MNPFFTRKPFIAAQIEVISCAITHNRLDDAEAVLAGVRVLRPRLAELDTFEAWIAIKRGHWQDAIRTLHKLDASTQSWSLGKALMAFCQFAVGDAAWSISANEVLEGESTAEARGLVRLLMGPGADELDADTEASTATATGFSDYDPRSLHHAAFLRA